MSSDGEKRTVDHHPVETKVRDLTKEEVRGYQPPATGGPEGRNPPTGGSSVAPAPQTSGNKKE